MNSENNATADAASSVADETKPLNDEDYELHMSRSKKFFRWFIKPRPGLLINWMKHLTWRFVYELMAYLIPVDLKWSYMNYGYLSESGKTVRLEAEDETERSGIYSIQLYHEVVSAVPVKDKDLLEVGSGRGGGASYVARYLKPKTVTGVELSSAAVNVANQIHAEVPNLRFVQGDACNLDLPDNSFDVLFNVESSHCYPDFKKFIAEALRVLRPGGYLVMCDFRLSEDFAQVDSAFQDAIGLEVIQQENITPGVLRGLEAASKRREELVKEYTGREEGFFWKTALAFAGCQGYGVYENFASGFLEYRRYTLQKKE